MLVQRLETKRCGTVVGLGNAVQNGDICSRAPFKGSQGNRVKCMNVGAEGKVGHAALSSDGEGEGALRSAIWTGKFKLVLKCPLWPRKRSSKLASER
jgi:hypothetical protein